MPRNLFKIYQEMCGEVCSPRLIEKIAEEIIARGGNISLFIIPNLADNFLEMQKEKEGDTIYKDDYMDKRDVLIEEIYVKMRNNAIYILANPKKIRACKVEEMIDPEKNEQVKEKLVKKMPHEFEARILVEYADSEIQKTIDQAKNFLTQVRYDKEEINMNKLENLIHKLVKITT